VRLIHRIEAGAVFAVPGIAGSFEHGIKANDLAHGKILREQGNDCVHLPGRLQGT
jgi:hypothetical protein